MTLPQKELSELLAAIAKAIAADDKNTINRLHLALKVAPSAERKSRTTSTKPTSNLAQNSLFDEKEIVRIFNSFPDREKLEDYIEKRQLKKIDLIYIARLLKVAIYKSDDAEAVISKIVDATLGYKLRSNTIRGREE